MTGNSGNDETRACEKIAVDARELQALLSCGRKTAEEIGMKAEARIKVGKRVLWNVSKLRLYLDAISTGC